MLNIQYCLYSKKIYLKPLGFLLLYAFRLYPREPIVNEKFTTCNEQNKPETDTKILR